MMKTLKTITVAMTLLFTASINAQDLQLSEVPQSFTEGLLKVYPTATDIEWEKNGTDYKVEFEVGKMEHEIWFNKDGETVRVEKKLIRAEVPKNLAAIIKRDYPNYRIDSVESTFMNGQTTYEVELEKSWNKTLKITYTVEGKVLRSIEV